MCFLFMRSKFFKLHKLSYLLRNALIYSIYLWVCEDSEVGWKVKIIISKMYLQVKKKKTISGKTWLVIYLFKCHFSSGNRLLWFSTASICSLICVIFASSLLFLEKKPKGAISCCLLHGFEFLAYLGRKEIVYYLRL